MQFTTIATLLFVALGAAAPTEQYLPEKGDGSGSNLCSNDQKAACCDGSGTGLLGGVLGGILSGNCALTVIGGSCTQGSIACCPTSGQTGLVNVGSICAPITL
ncbi:hypothetical protein M409DRAFT_17785 [Zasmidium cellare ATCC 36951]|uniref:Hydrophobin n=1 Tax=Zasmidium cellare ATCC 36951 TaxID=1080233 RepID=A0A6A6CZH5_ZASCE|nr:uncharacterized protein M409DRAFT_17785 [Zasmidium cellare ATCC 36951]KAF2172554.1 hypothetical protein M409DRAFT_17785 [Zasmidium cellare ATCC 36951]